MRSGLFGIALGRFWPLMAHCLINKLTREGFVAA